jgi:hypothetical protein
MVGDENLSESQGPLESSQAPAQHVPEDSLQAVLQGASLNEDLALALIKRNDLPPEALELLSKSAAMKSRKVRLALAEHPKTPHHVSLPLVRHLFTFELMQVALAPVTPADVKLAAEQALIHRLETVSAGEKLSLARMGSGRVAAALLLDSEPRVILTALDNARLTEAAVFKALTRSDTPARLVQAVCHHPQWSLRREVRVALLRNENTPLARALEFVRTLPAPLAREVLQASRLPANIKAHLLQKIGRAGSAGAHSSAS